MADVERRKSQIQSWMEHSHEEEEQGTRKGDLALRGEAWTRELHLGVLMGRSMRVWNKCAYRRVGNKKRAGAPTEP